MAKTKFEELMLTWWDTIHERHWCTFSRLNFNSSIALRISKIRFNRSFKGGIHEWTLWYELGLAEEGEFIEGKPGRSKLEGDIGSHAQGEKPRDVKGEGR
jgi:hypothetical protein